MLSPVQRAMIATLRHGQTVPTDRLVIAVYSGCKDGGPDNAAHAIRAQICKMRDKLKPYGVEIETVGHGRGAVGYRVRPDHRQALEKLLAEIGDVMVM